MWAQEEGDFTGTCGGKHTQHSACGGGSLWIPAGDLGWDLGDTSDAWGLDQQHRSLFTCWLPSHLPAAVISIHGSGNDCRGVKVMIPTQPGLPNLSGELGTTSGSASQRGSGEHSQPCCPLADSLLGHPMGKMRAGPEFSEPPGKAMSHQTSFSLRSALLSTWEMQHSFITLSFYNSLQALKVEATL